MLYLCWAKNNNIIGVATSKKHAERMCEEVGSCYMKVEPNVIPNGDIDVTKLCTHHTKYGFFTYDEAEKIVKELINKTNYF